MSAMLQHSAVQPVDPLLTLLELARKARSARGTDELAFIAVNDTHALWPYRQAALWMRESRIQALSGVVDVEANAPYALWLARLCKHLHATLSEASAISAVELPSELASEWAEWLPTHGLWLPLHAPDQGVSGQGPAAGGLLLAADTPWPDNILPALTEWAGIWLHAWQALEAGQTGWLARWPVASPGTPAKPLWQRRTLIAAIAAAVCVIPVKLSVLAPGELVPANPAVVRAPLDGVVTQFHVQPNQRVKAGQPLFSFDQVALAAHRDVATQTLATAQAEYRQFAQQAVSDARSKAQLAGLLGRIEEKQAEASYLQDQLQRASVSAPQDGIALFDDPTEWIGKPVQTGERVLRIAAPDDIEVEAWLPMGDAIPLAEHAQVELFLAASPLHPVKAELRYIAHDATLRPDGQYAYRVRARLQQPAAADTGKAQRIGLKGTAKLSGESVPLIYWVLRRPLATVRQTLGW